MFPEIFSRNSMFTGALGTQKSWLELASSFSAYSGWPVWTLSMMDLQKHLSCESTESETCWPGTRPLAWWVLVMMDALPSNEVGCLWGEQEGGVASIRCILCSLISRKSFHELVTFQIREIWPFLQHRILIIKTNSMQFCNYQCCNRWNV